MTFLGVLSDLHLGDQRVTLEEAGAHVFSFFFFRKEVETDLNDFFLGGFCFFGCFSPNRFTCGVLS